MSNNITVKVIDNNDVFDIDRDEIKHVITLKSYVEEHHNIPFDMQILVHNQKFPVLMADNMQVLVHNQQKPVLMADNNSELPGEMLVYTRIKPQLIDFSVEVDTSDEVLHFKIPSKKTVLDLKMMIDESFGVPPNRQDLYIMRQQLYQYDPLDNYIVEDEPRVYCTVQKRADEGFDINIEVDDGDMRSLTVEGADTIFTLHGDARRAGIPWGDKYYFTWNGEPLIGTRTLNSYGITAGVTLKLVKRVEIDDDYGGARIIIDDSSTGNYSLYD